MRLPWRVKCSTESRYCRSAASRSPVADRDRRQLGEAAADLVVVSELAEERERLLPVRACDVERALPVREDRAVDERTRPQRRIAAGGARDRRIEVAARLGQLAADHPELAGRDEDVHLERDVAGGDRPGECGAKVLGLVDQVVVVGSRALEKELGVRAAARVDVGQMLEGVLTDRLEQREAAGRAAAHEALVDERCDGLHVTAERFGRVDREAAGENGEPRQQVALVRLRELVAPVERRAQRPLAFGQVAGASREEVERLLEAAGDRPDREELDPCCGELDRERQPVEATADLGDIGRRLSSTENAGSTAAARAPKSRTASSGSSGGTGYSCSPERRSGARLVARIRRRGASRSRRETSVTSGSSCSRLSRTRSMLRPRRSAANSSSSGSSLS